MKRRRRSAKALLFAIVLLASLLFSGVASATSTYDGVIDNVDNVYLSRNAATQGSPTCGLQDLTHSWDSVMAAPTAYDSLTQYIGGINYSDLMTAWDETLDNGVGWAVSQVQTFSQQSPGVGGDPFGDYIRVVFTPTASAVAVFDDNAVYFGSQKQLYLSNTDNTDVYVVQIAFDDPAGGMLDECVPRVKTVIKEPSSTPSFWENESVATTSTSGGYVVKPLFVNAPIAYPSGYEGELAKTEQPVAEYVFMGDSVSSGEGNPSFEAGTDDDDVNKCHRSAQSYPRLLQDELSLRSVAFVACSGATTDDVLGVTETDNPLGRWNELAQTSVLSAGTEAIAITIGGNNVGFAVYATNCAVAVCGPSSVPYGNIMQEISDPAFKVDLVVVYKEILSRASQAKLYVLGYPRMTPPANATDCTHTPDGNDLGPRNVVDSLNTVIQDAVNDVNGDSEFVNRIEYVEVNATNPPSPLLGKYICSSNPAFNDVDFTNTEYSYHPNALGHEGYAQLLEDAIG